MKLAGAALVALRGQGKAVTVRAWRGEARRGVARLGGHGQGEARLG